jgi:Glycosyl hydrolase 108
MNTSELLSGAGNVAVGVREQEETLRAARLRQLQIEDANRQDELRRQMNAAPAPAAPMGDFNDLGPAQQVLPGLKPPREYVPSAAPAPQTTNYGKPAAVKFGTQGNIDAVKANPKISLTREQFLALPKSEQQRIYKESLPKNMVGGSTVIRAPLKGGLGTARAMVPSPATTYRTPTGVAPKAPTFDEYVQGLPSPSQNKRSAPYRRASQQAGGLATDADTAIANVLGVEGGYANNANDTGGETNFGISSVNNPDVDVNSLTPESAAAIYKERYWDAINADSLPPAIREIAFDAAVQHGPSTAKNLIRMSGGDPQRLLAERKKLYDAIVANNPTQREFYDGWMNRLAGLAAKIAGGVVSSANAATGPVGDVSGIAEGGGSGVIEFDPQAQAKPGVKSAAETKTPAQFYLANPDAVSHDMRMVQQQRAELVQLAGMYQRSGMGQQYMEARAKVQEIDNNLVLLAGVQGVTELREANDPRRLAKALSFKTGIPTELIPRTDGTLDVVINGTVVEQGAPRNRIMDEALSMFDPAYRDRKGKMSEDAYKSQLKREEDTSSQTAQMIREIAVAGKKGNLDMALEWAKQNWGWEIKGPAADGTYLIKPPGEAPRWFDPAGEIIDIDGTEVVSRGAKPIAGLTTGAR